MAFFIGADLGGTHFRVGAREEGSDRILDVETVPADAGWSTGDLVGQIDTLLARIVRRHPGCDWRFAALGLGLTGDPDPATGVCASMTRFPRLEGVALADVLRQRLRVPAHVMNDGQVAALGELRAGAGREVRSFLMITLGTGVGGAVVMDGKLIVEPHGRFGKVGHQVIFLDGPCHCHCGLPGCWQGLVGKTGVLARAREAALAGSPLAAALSHPEPDLHIVVDLAERGDAAARRVMEETGRLTGIGLANVIKTLAPERAVVGGGIAEGSTVLLAAAQRAVDDYAVLPWQRIPVTGASFGADAGVAGATYLAEGLP